jgi:hypothetical protein
MRPTYKALFGTRQVTLPSGRYLDTVTMVRTDTPDGRGHGLIALASAAVALLFFAGVGVRRKMRLH